jgi:hypothetical protein
MNTLRRSLPLTVVLACFACITVPSAVAQAAGQTTFASSQQALDGFIQAIRDNKPGEVSAILGPDSTDVISSGDAIADENTRQKFLERYDRKHALVSSGPHQLTLNIDTDDWPVPIPLVEKDGKWYWDGAAGKEEIVYRRIGHNELSAIQVCKGVVSAQKDYAAASHDGVPAGAYAQRIMSEAAKQNGLFWEAKEGENPSPAGPMLADASQEGYELTGGETRAPYHGYYYRMLKAQGKSAKGGAKSYIVDGKMSGGFAFLAYPAQYRVSGVMSFVVNQNGVIYQKDLGEKTDDIAQQMTEYNPDASWKIVK